MLFQHNEILAKIIQNGGLSVIDAESSSYWDEYYRSQRVGTIICPSQFAAFVAQEKAAASNVLEIGCGNGRDSFFFAQQGFRVVGIDRSEDAIRKCNETKATLAPLPITFVRASVSESTFRDILASHLPNDRSYPCLFYARFFIHAISEDDEDAFLSTVSDLMQSKDSLALEFRTIRDASLTKITPTHFRRFIQPHLLTQKAAALGMVVEYAVEGFGYAKYRDDDAYVARVIFTK